MINGLDKRRQWVVFRSEDGRKPPYQARNPTRNASSTDRRTWASLEEARACVDAGDADGVGYALTQDDRIVFIDLDKCRDPDTGAISAWAQEILERFEGHYVEPSVSGTGLHIVVHGTLPSGGRRRGSIEMYWRERLMYATGEPLPDRGELLDDVPGDALRWLWERLGGGDDVDVEPVRVSLDDSRAGVRRAMAIVEAACENDPDFLHAWNLTQGWYKAGGMCPDWSRYDWKIACCLARAGVDDDAVADVIALFRETRCSDPADVAKGSRLDYLGRTIARAKSPQHAEPQTGEVSRELEAKRRKVEAAHKREVDARRGKVEASAEVHQAAEREHQQREVADARYEVAEAGHREDAFAYVSERLRAVGVDLTLVDVVRYGTDPGEVFVTFDDLAPINFGPAEDLPSLAKFKRTLTKFTERVMILDRDRSLKREWEERIVTLLFRHMRRVDPGDGELHKRVEDVVTAQLQASGSIRDNKDVIREYRLAKRAYRVEGSDEEFVFLRTLMHDCRFVGVQPAVVTASLRRIGFEPRTVRVRTSSTTAWVRRAGDS